MAREYNLGKDLIDVREAIKGNSTRLRFIIRFSNCPRIHNESVAEHSFYTAYFTFLLSLALKKNGLKIDMGVALGKALMHDVDECYSGDFIRMFKHSSPELKKAIDNASSNFTKQLANELAFSDALAENILYHWKEAKEELEGKIVSFADYLSVLSYIVQEVDAGNDRMLLQVNELRKFHTSFRKPEYSILEDYIKMTEDIIIELEMRRGTYELQGV